MEQDPDIPFRFHGNWEQKFSFLPTEVLDISGMRKIFWRPFFRRMIFRLDLDICWYEKVSVAKFLELTR